MSQPMNMFVLALMFGITFAAFMLLTYVVVYEQTLLLVTIVATVLFAFTPWHRR
jgi:hypothetical protein